MTGKIREYHVKAEVKKQLKALGAYQFWPVQTGMGASTVDCLACFAGCFVAIETKAPSKRPTPRQELTINAIVMAGGISVVIDSVAMAKCLPELLHGTGRIVANQPGPGVSGAHVARTNSV